MKSNVKRRENESGEYQSPLYAEDIFLIRFENELKNRDFNDLMLQLARIRREVSQKNRKELMTIMHIIEEECARRMQEI